MGSTSRHSTPPTIDKHALIQLQSPRGLILELETNQIPSNVVEFLRQHTQEGDTRAAVAMAQLTGLSVTIKRTVQTTVRAEDLDK
jgi:hypothetical protein